MPDPSDKDLSYRILEFFASRCRDVSPLISESMDHQVSFIKKIKIKFHLMLCEFCCRYKEQLESMRYITKNLKQKDDPKVYDDSQLDESAKDRMKKLLEEEK